MLKKSLLIIGLTSSIYAADAIENVDKKIVKTQKNTKSNSILNNEKYQIFANKLESKNNIVTVTGDVVIFSKSYYMTAQKAIYNKNNETFELFDEVVILKDNALHSNSDYSFIDMKSDDLIQTPTLVLNKTSSVWINSSKSNKTTEVIQLEKSILSSCDCDDPDWTIDFSSGSYDTKSQWVETFNNKIYVGSVPVFYLPYFAFPTDDTRRSGILIPSIGQSSKEGFLLNQPIYLAPADNYDIEFIPQVRTKRGKGIYAYLRYTDSPFSTLYFNTGIFSEKDKYFTENSLKNKKHFGFDLQYKRGKLFTKSIENQDGLFINVDWINDVEFKNLEDENHKESYSKKIESNVNYFYNTPGHYSGIYFTHYLDTSLDSNDTTMQKLPQTQFHTYSEPILFDKLLYSTDTIYTNYHRKEGINANRIDFSLPFTYSYFLLNDYIRLTLINTTTVSHLKYSNSSTQFSDGTFVENTSIVSLGTDITKPYDNYIHTVNFNVDFTIPTTLSETGDLYSITNSDSELKAFSISKTLKTVDFSLNHSIYDKDDLAQIVNHKIKQSIIYSDFDTKLSNLENEVTFNHTLGSLSNRLIYSQEDGEFIESSSGLNLSYNDYFFNATYYVSKDTPNSGKEDLESYTLKTGFKFLDDFKLTYEQNYNIKKHLVSKDKFSFNIDDSCWNFDIKYGKELITTSTGNGNSATYQDTIFFTLELKQLGGVNFVKKIKEQ